MKLLSDSESDSENHINEIRINKKYAVAFEKKEKAKDIERAKHLDLYSDSESDESEDSDAELLSDKLDLEIISTIQKIRNKDPSIYDKNVSLYSKQEENEDSDDESGEEKHKKKTYKDVVREQLLKDGAGSDIEDYEEDNGKRSSKLNNFLYDKEQEDLRKEFLKNINDNDSDNDDDSDNELFQEKKTVKKSSEVEEKKLKEAILSLKTSSNDEKEAFLLNYFSNKQWKDPKFKFANEKSDSEDENDIIDEEDEEAVEAMENFESKYNFRFEEVTESGSGTVSQVQGHARNVEGSLRRVEDKRKKKREERKEKKEREKRQKEEEIKRLKNLKRQELNERLKKIGNISGLKKLGVLNEEFLDDEWDEAKHEEYMKREFDDEYYDEEDDEFQVKEGEDGPLNEDELRELIGDDYDEYSKEYQAEAQAYAEGEEDDEGDEDAEINDEDRKMIEKNIEELYSLDYEDIIAGMPCRFKYAKVEPDDFGLTTDEIIAADDKTLNKYLSLKYLSPYRPVDKEKLSSKLKKRQKGFKYSIRESLLKLKEEEEKLKSAPSYVNTGKISKKEEDLTNDKKKRRKRKKNEEDLVPKMKPITEDTTTTTTENYTDESPLKKLKINDDNNDKKKRNRKHKKKN